MFPLQLQRGKMVSLEREGLQKEEEEKRKSESVREIIRESIKCESERREEDEMEELCKVRREEQRLRCEGRREREIYAVTAETGEIATGNYDERAEDWESFFLC